MKSLRNIILIPFVLFTTHCIAQPANDDPCGAIQIPVITDVLGQDCSPSNSLGWTNATLTPATPNPSCVLNPSNIRDVWYKIIVPSSGKIKINTSAILLYYLVAYNPSVCNSTISFTEISCLLVGGGGIEAMILSSLTPGSTIYLRIMRYTSTVVASGGVNMCISEVLNIPVIDNSKKVGIGTDIPLAKLDINGTTIVRDSLLVTKNIETRSNLKSNTFQLTNGAVNGNVLQSDANGNGTWVSPTSIGAGQHYIGESFAGGIVFYVYDNGKHGLIAAPTDQSTGITWWNGSNIDCSSVRDGVGGGMANTQIIIMKQGPGPYAASICMNYNGGGYGDWYLPSKHELNLLYLQKDVVGGFASDAYWSSTETSGGGAWGQGFASGDQGGGPKLYTGYVRAVRAF